jgi:hypothetical protein
MVTIAASSILKKLRKTNDANRSIEVARQTKRAAHTKALSTLLASIPTVDASVIESAVIALLDAADQYTASQPLVDPKGRRSKPSIAEARANVAELLNHLDKAQKLLSHMPLDAIAAISQATDMPVGKMRADIAQIQLAVEQALAELASRPNKVADAARNVLAYQVAVVFRDLLKLVPTSTTERQLTQNMSTARGGAAYARTLRATLEVADVLNYDPGPLILAGLELLEDPQGTINKE